MQHERSSPFDQPGCELFLAALDAESGLSGYGSFVGLSTFARTVQKGQLVTVEGILRYRSARRRLPGVGD